MFWKCQNVAAPYHFCQPLGISDCRHVVSMSGNLNSRMTFVHTWKLHCCLGLNCILSMTCCLIIIIIAFKSLGQNKGTMQTYIERQRFQREKSFELLIAYDVLSGSAESAAVRSNSFFFSLTVQECCSNRGKGWLPLALVCCPQGQDLNILIWQK